MQGELPDEIQDQIYRPSVEEAGYSVDLEFRKPKGLNAEDGNGEVEIEVETPDS